MVNPILQTYENWPYNMLIIYDCLFFFHHDLLVKKIILKVDQRLNKADLFHGVNSSFVSHSELLLQEEIHLKEKHGSIKG